jgi:hypothetical protein
MEYVETARINAFLQALGKRYPRPATLFLLGGSALCLLGSSRPTLDIDYVGDDLKQDDLQRAMAQVAHDMQIEVEAIPIAQFVPRPAGAQERSVSVGQFGKIEVYVFDPYTIALSKIDRGFDTDIEDVVFLIRRNLITFEQLETIVLAALERANEFDLNPATARAHLQVVRNQL